MFGWAKQKGFTIVELLVVIVVIGILATIVMTSFSGARQKAETAKVISAVHAQELLMKMAYAANGTYPSSGNNFVCLGDAANYPASGSFSSGQCVAGSTPMSVSSTVNNALTDFSSTVPDASIPEVSIDSFKVRGLIYIASSNQRGAVIFYSLNGTQKCDLGVDVSADGSGYSEGATFCKLVFGNPFWDCLPWVACVG